MTSPSTCTAAKSSAWSATTAPASRLWSSASPGVLHPTEGEIHLDGDRHEFASPAEARSAGVETVYQDLALVEQFDLTANLFLGRELVRPAGWVAWVSSESVTWRSRRGRRSASCRPTSQTSTPRSTACPGASARSVAISKAAFWGRHLLLLDEPTAALGVQESAGVLEMISPHR